MSHEQIYLKIDDSIAQIVLNRPDKRNALTWDMWTRLGEIVDELEGNDAIKAVIVRGVDATAFAAGADIVEFETVYAEQDTSVAYTNAMQDSERKLARLEKPTVALIQGPCIGAGCGIAMCCDVRFADDTASFAIPPARLGLAYSLGDTKRLVDVIGPARAKDMMYTARLVKAEEAYHMGLIDRLVGADELHASVDKYVGSIASLSRFTNQTTKRTVQMILDGAEDDTDDTRAHFMKAFSGEDFQEGRAAFLEKRKPKFTW